MDAQELRDRKRALDMAERLRTSPQGLHLSIRSCGSSEYREIPMVVMSSRGGAMSAFEHKECSIMISLQREIAAAVDRAHSKFMALALAEEDQPEGGE